MQLKVVFTNGRRATKVGFSGDGVTLQWIESPSDLPVTITILTESVPEELQLMLQAFVITKFSCPVHQHGKHSLFVGRVMVVVGVGMEIEVRVCVCVGLAQ
jgi:hypothetical protein